MDVGEVMVHRRSMQTVDGGLTSRQIVADVLASQHSRVPVYADEPENVIGVLHAKDLLQAIADADGDIDAVDIRSILREPWFLYLAFNAAHEPFHAPPAYLHSYALNGDPNDTPFEHVCATIEALDTEIGRLLNGIDPAVLANTTILLMGDNGSVGAVIEPPWHGAGKGSLSESGVRVPLIVSGRGVTAPGRESSALVQVVDVFATVAELFEVDVGAAMPDARPIDSISFAPILRDPGAVGARSRVYCDAFTPNGFGPYDSRKRMLGDGRWKVIETSGAPDRFYDLSTGLIDSEDLLLEPPLTPEQQAAYDALKLELQTFAGS